MPPSLVDLALYPWFGTVDFMTPPGAGASFRSTAIRRRTDLPLDAPPFVDKIFLFWIFKLLAINKKTIERSHLPMTDADGLVSLIFLSSFPPTRVAGA